MKSEQLSLFSLPKHNGEMYSYNEQSTEIFISFDVLNIGAMSFADRLPSLYSSLSLCVPTEKISFKNLSYNDAIVAELICAAICHQINWDFLRQAILDQTLINPDWLSVQHISNIRPKEIAEILATYSKPDRIKANERAAILRNLGITYLSYGNGFLDIFFTEDGIPQTYDYIRRQLLLCNVFSEDIVEKKLQLLLMKLSAYKNFEALGACCLPTIDYHLIRSFLRRGFLVPQNKQAMEVVFSSKYRKNTTVGAVRKHCVNIVNQLCSIGQMNVGRMNYIEWWIGRSVCKEGAPDCDISKNDSAWLRNSFERCPFYDFCKAKQNTFFQQGNLIDVPAADHEDSFLLISGPKYKGTNY